MDLATNEKEAKNSLDSANFINERNFQVSQRERSARKSGMLPNRLDSLDSSRIPTPNKSGQKAPTKTNATGAAPSVPTTMPSNQAAAPSVAGRSCMSLASELQDVVANARRCFDSNEIRKLLSLQESSALPICLAIVMSAIAFILGVYVTKKGVIDIPC